MILGASVVTMGSTWVGVGFRFSWADSNGLAWRRAGNKEANGLTGAASGAWTDGVMTMVSVLNSVAVITWVAVLTKVVTMARQLASAANEWLMRHADPKAELWSHGFCKILNEASSGPKLWPWNDLLMVWEFESNFVWIIPTGGWLPEQTSGVLMDSSAAVLVAMSAEGTGRRAANMCQQHAQRVRWTSSTQQARQRMFGCSSFAFTLR